MTNNYKRLLSYNPIFSTLLSDLILISIIISFSKLNITTSVKSSASFMIAVSTVMLSVVSLYTKIRFCLLLRRKDLFKKYLEKLIQEQKRYNDYKNMNIYLLRITNKMPLQTNIRHHNYDKELKRYINNIDRVGLDKNSKKKLYLYLTNK